MPSLARALLFLCCALAVCGCTKTAGTTKGWATRLTHPPAGLTLTPPAPDDVYWVSVVSAEIPSRTTGGQIWDEVGGWPDPVAILKIDDATVMQTEVAEDTLKPLWNSPSGNLVIPPGSRLSVELADQDAVKNVQIGRASSGPPTFADVSEGRMTFDLGNRAKLTLRVEPAHGLLGLGFDYEIVAGRTLVKRVLKHSPAGRSGLGIGDEIVSIDGRELGGLKARDVRSAINSVGSITKPFVIKNEAGGVRTLKLGVEAIYPLYDEYGAIN